MNNDFSIEAKFFRGLSDATRFSVLQTLVDGEKTVGQIVDQTNQSQPNISNHLKCLLDCALVESRREGKNIYYSLRDPKIKDLLEISHQVISKAASHIAACLRYKK